MADRLGPPMRDDRGLSPVPQPPMPPRAMPAQAGPPADRYGRYDEPTGAFAGGYDAPRGGYDAPRGPGGPGPMGPGAPMGHGGPPPRGLPPGPGGYGQDDSRYGQDEQRFDGFEAGRHGRADMTAEIRMSERELRDMRGRGPAGPPALPQQGMGGGPPMAGPPSRWPADGRPADGRAARQRALPGGPDPAQLPGAPLRQRVRPGPGGPLFEPCSVACRAATRCR